MYSMMHKIVSIQMVQIERVDEDAIETNFAQVIVWEWMAYLPNSTI